MYALSVLIVIDPITDFANKSNPSVGSLYTYSANESLIINPIQKVNQNSDITIPDTSLRFFFQFEYFDIEKQNFRIITKTELQNLFGSKNSLFYPSVLYIQKYKPNSEISFSNTNILEQDRFTFCDETQKTKSIVFGDYNIGLEYNERNKTQEEINNIMLNSLCLPDSFNSLNKELEIANLEDSEKMLSFIFNTEMVNKLTNTGKFSNVHITINYQKLAVNFDSLYFNNYYRKIWTKKTFLIEPNKIKLSYSFIQRSNLERDTSIFLTSIKKSQAIYTIESFDEYLNLPISNDKSTMQSSVNLGIILKMNTYVLNTSIKYVSVDDIIGLWGGTIDVLKTIAEIVLGVIINPFFVTSLINSVYSFHDSSAKESEILDFNKDINNLGELKDIMKRSPIKPRKTSIPSIILNNIDSINQIDNNSSKNNTNIINFNSGKDNISKQVNLSLIQNNEKNELQTKVKSLEMLTSKEGPNSPNIQYVNIIGSNKKLNDINVDEHSLNEEDSSKTIVNRLNDL